MPLNFLLITADDLNYNSPGFTGGTVPDVTPNLDRLATEGLWFRHAHVASAVCQPSRQAMMTGLYPHNMRALGFDPIDERIPTLQELLGRAGYFNGILGKVTHLAPRGKFPWDYQRDAEELGMGRAPELYYRNAREFLAMAKAEGKPFFLMANSGDPHRPFAGSEDASKHGAKYPPATRYYRPDEVALPGFLPDLPDVRKEVAEYFTSVHRLDQTVGEVLRALRESGKEENTLVMFTTDHGMAFPFAKANCYPSSTRSPWLVRWPGRTKVGSVDSDHFICGVDFMPTILEAAGLPALPGLDGRSFLPLLTGRKQAGRESVFTVFNITSARRTYPMRAIQDRHFAYIFNAWSDGKLVYQAESQHGLTWKAMVATAPHDPGVAQRAAMYTFRTREELYQLDRDPDCLENLVADAAFGAKLDMMRRALREKMAGTTDPLLGEFDRAQKNPSG